MDSQNIWKLPKNIKKFKVGIKKRRQLTLKNLNCLQSDIIYAL